MELFKLDPGLIIWTWIAFGALLFILGKFVFPSLLNNIKSREKLIAQSVDEADSIHKRLEDINVEYAEVIKKAHTKADAILLQTRKDAEVLKSTLLEKAEKEAADIVTRARLKTAEERDMMLRSLEKELADFVCSTAEQVVGRSFTSSKDHELARELVQTL